MEIVDIDNLYSKLKLNENEMETFSKVCEYLSPFEEGFQFTSKFKAGFWDGKKYFYDYLSEDNSIRFLKTLSNGISDSFNIPYKNTKEYFFDYVCKMPVDMNNEKTKNKPPTIRLIEFPAANCAVIHYDYPKSSTYESQKIIKRGNSFKIYREEKSELAKII